MTDATHDDPAGDELRRISSGNPEVDEILGGGFPVNSINIVMGHPGTGKTIFVQQLVFHNAGDDRPVLYLTTLSEPLAKVIRYLQRFSFYDESKIGSAVVYQDIAPELAERGVDALPGLLKEAIATLAPKIVVIDSFKVLHDLAPAGPAMRRMVYELTGLLSAYDTTVFLVGEYGEEHARTDAEFAAADGILQFFRHDRSNRDERFMRVLKLRGSGYAEGVHGFRVTDAGLQVFPRLVSPALPPAYEVAHERVATGVPGLDELLCGGLWRGSTTLVVGPTGSGKTTLGVQFALAGMRRGEPSLYVNLQENPTQLARLFHGLGVDLSAAQASGLHLLYESPVELQIDRLVSRVFRLLQEHGLKRVVIDSLGELASAAGDAQRLHDYMYALMQHFVVRGTTCIVTCETQRGRPSITDSVDGLFSYMTDNLIQLDTAIGSEVQRTLCVVKARCSAHSLAVHPLQLGPDGARVS